VGSASASVSASQSPLWGLGLSTGRGCCRLFRAARERCDQRQTASGLRCPYIAPSVILSGVAGLIAADLGGGVIKQRIARPSQGKSGGFRTLIVFRAGARASFVHGFAKNEKDNIEKDELAALKRLAAELLAYDDKTLAGVIATGTLVEVGCDAKTIP